MNIRVFYNCLLIFGRVLCPPFIILEAKWTAGAWADHSYVLMLLFFVVCVQQIALSHGFWFKQRIWRA